MSRAIILSGGEIDIGFLKKQAFGREDRIICADRGLFAADRLSLVPDLIVGDFDSGDPAVMAKYKETGVKILSFPPEKDDTDTELALHMAMEKAPEEIWIYGGSGTRLDHTLANIGLLKQPMERGIRAYLCDERNRICMMRGSYSIKKTEQFGTYISLLPFGGDAKGVTLRGFQYPLENAVIAAGSSLGVSNELISEEGIIEVKEGILLVMESRD